MKKTVKLSLSAVGLFAAVLVLSGCSGATGTPQGAKPEKVDVSAQSDNKTVQKEKETFKLGDAIKLGDYVVTATKLEDPFKSKNQYLGPKAGNRLVAVEVLYENNTADKSLNYNPFDWKLSDSDGYKYDMGITDSREPRLSSGTLNPAGKVRGWITFEVPVAAKEFKLQFAPSMLSNDNAEVQLY